MVVSDDHDYYLYSESTQRGPFLNSSDYSTSINIYNLIKYSYKTNHSVYTYLSTIIKLNCCYYYI